MSWSTSELRVRLAPLNRFKPSSKIFYWPFQGGTSFVDLLCFCSVLCLLCFVRVCLYVLFGHLLGKGWPLGSRLWCLLWVCHFPIGILGQVWYLIVSIPDLCTITYFWYQSLVIDIGLYFHCSVFYHLWLFHSLNAAHFKSSNAYNFLICEQKQQVRVVIFLVRTWGPFWYQNNSDLLKFFDFKFSTPPASVSEAMHVTYATQRHQQIMTSLLTPRVSHFDAE